MTDVRREYNQALLKLALEKTTNQYGPYELVASSMMNAARSELVAKNGELKNFFIKLSVSEKRINELGYVNFPVDRGIVGYRVFFASPNVKDKLKTVTSLEQLKVYTMGQGIGWLDNKILTYNGFKVMTGSSYEGLFRMVAAGRIDLFPRGTNELYKEFQSHKHIRNLVYDDSIALYYPLPRFFFTSKNNIKAIERVQKGLITAYKDGSFDRLWKQYYQQSIDFVNLKKRKIFTIDNPFIKGIDSSYSQYIYTP